MENETYDQLVAELERIFHIGSVCRLLEWDSVWLKVPRAWRWELRKD